MTTVGRLPPARMGTMLIFPPSPIGLAGVATVGGEPKLDPNHMAEAYWHLANQHPTAWTLELDLRPQLEKFFE